MDLDVNKKNRVLLIGNIQQKMMQKRSVNLYPKKVVLDKGNPNEI